jgi:hypothetical protein
MYTTFLIDEFGNQKIIMDWRDSPPFDWSEVTVDQLRASHPNHLHGLEFGYYYTGDDWRSMSGTSVGPEAGLLPDFKNPDLPCPRQTFESKAARTRDKPTAEKSAPTTLNCTSCGWTGGLDTVKILDRESRYFYDWVCPTCDTENAGGHFPDKNLPIRSDIKAYTPSMKPRLRCGLCAWSEALPEPFGLRLPSPEQCPPKPDSADTFSKLIINLVSSGKTNRRSMANALGIKKPWKYVDAWLKPQPGLNPRYMFPDDQKLQLVAGSIDQEEVTVEALKHLVAQDSKNYIKLQEWNKWKLRYRYPDWATTVTKPDGVWYTHLHCERTTHDLSEVASKPELRSLTFASRIIEFVKEEWVNDLEKWTSYAFLKSELQTPCSEFTSTLRNELKVEESISIRWSSTVKFWFAIT